MKRLLTNIKCVIATVLVIIAISIILSACCHDWTWFSRSGGVATLLGGVLATRRVIRFGVDDLFKVDHTINGGHVIPTPEEIESARQDRLDIFATKSAFWVISVGTIIWTFGDLLGLVFH